MSEEHRVKIKNSNILNALIEHVEGAREMSASQVTAGLGLLKKVLPDLTAGEMKLDVTDTLRELLDAVDGKSRGIPGMPDGLNEHSGTRH